MNTLVRIVLLATALVFLAACLYVPKRMWTSKHMDHGPSAEWGPVWAACYRLEPEPLTVEETNRLRNRLGEIETVGKEAKAREARELTPKERLARVAGDDHAGPSAADVEREAREIRERLGLVPAYSLDYVVDWNRLTALLVGILVVGLLLAAACWGRRPDARTGQP